MGSCSNWVWVGALGGLAVVLIWACFGRPTVSLRAFQVFRYVLALAAIVYAVVTLCRMVNNVALAPSIPEAFKPEMIGYLAFWVLVPPAWFFVEYFTFDNGAVELTDDQRTAQLTRIKNYADFASKVWAAIVALLIVFVSLKKS